MSQDGAVFVWNCDRNPEDFESDVMKRKHEDSDDEGELKQKGLLFTSNFVLK